LLPDRHTVPPLENLCISEQTWGDAPFLADGSCLHEQDSRATPLDPQYDVPDR